MTNTLSWLAANSTTVIIGLAVYISGAIATWWMLRGFEIQPDCNNCFHDDRRTCANCYPERWSGSLFEDDGAVFEMMEILVHLVMSVFWPISIMYLLGKYAWEWLVFASEFTPLRQVKDAILLALFILILLFSKEDEDDLDHIIRG